MAWAAAASDPYAPIESSPPQSSRHETVRVGIIITMTLLYFNFIVYTRIDSICPYTDVRRKSVQSARNQSEP